MQRKYRPGLPQMQIYIRPPFTNFGHEQHIKHKSAMISCYNDRKLKSTGVRTTSYVRTNTTYAQTQASLLQYTSPTDKNSQNRLAKAAINTKPPDNNSSLRRIAIRADSQAKEILRSPPRYIAVSQGNATLHCKRRIEK
jgi:hypothetical protein